MDVQQRIQRLFPRLDHPDSAAGFPSPTACKNAAPRDVDHRCARGRGGLAAPANQLAGLGFPCQGLPLATPKGRP